jgi:cell division protein FtsA
MDLNTPKLFIEINNSDYIFIVGDKNESNDFKIKYKCIVPIQGIKNSKIIDFSLVKNIIQTNIYLIEQKLNFIFKEVILIISDFDCSFISLSGFKKLNGSQILKENITYILNSLKSNINKTEDKKTILHIFNTKFNLDKKTISNLPVGLFGDFYSQEISFCLINSNEYKNIINIFAKCNLRIKKILLKSFLEAAYVSDDNKNFDTFFQININKYNSQILFVENDALKFEQNFNFGTDLVLKDICKVTSLKKEIVQKLIDSSVLKKDFLEDELIEKVFFEQTNYRKIKKKLLFKVAEARIEELLEYLLTKNVNFQYFRKKCKVTFLKVFDNTQLNCFGDIYSNFFSKNNKIELKLKEKTTIEELIIKANKLVHFGWKKEVIPVIQYKKSLIARFFDSIFN